MQEKVSAQYVNEIEMAKAQRDFELKKAAYDVEVNTKKAESEMAYQLQVQSPAFHLSMKSLAPHPLCLARWLTLLLGFATRWPKPSSASRRRRCRSRWWSARSRSLCRSRRSSARRRSWRPRSKSRRRQRSTDWRGSLRPSGEYGSRHLTASLLALKSSSHLNHENSVSSLAACSSSWRLRPRPSPSGWVLIPASAILTRRRILTSAFPNRPSTLFDCHFSCWTCSRFPSWPVI